MHGNFLQSTNTKFIYLLYRTKSKIYLFGTVLMFAIVLSKN